MGCNIVPVKRKVFLNTFDRKLLHTSELLFVRPEPLIIVLDTSNLPFGSLRRMCTNSSGRALANGIAGRISGRPSRTPFSNAISPAFAGLSNTSSSDSCCLTFSFIGQSLARPISYSILLGHSLLISPSFFYHPSRTHMCRFKESAVGESRRFQIKVHCLFSAALCLEEQHLLLNCAPVVSSILQAGYVFPIPELTYRQGHI